MPRASASAVAKLAKSTVSQSQKSSPMKVADRDLARRGADCRLYDKQQRQNRADLDHKHDRIGPLDVRAEHHEGLLQRLRAPAPARTTHGFLFAAEAATVSGFDSSELIELLLPFLFSKFPRPMYLGSFELSAPSQ